MNEFEASNGITVTLTDSAQLRVENADRTEGAVVAEGDYTDALREFFRAEEDERLGRWRRGDHVVYPGLSTDEYIFVLDEATGESDEIRAEYLRGETTDDPSLHEIDRTALLYLLSKPASKPWHDAKEGELWALTIDGAEDIYVIVRTEEAGFRMFPARSTAFRPGAFPSEVTAGRRIWPES